MRVVYKLEPIPTDAPTAFLAGPNPGRHGPPELGWRPAAISLFERVWPAERELALLVPEMRDRGLVDDHELAYEWEHVGRTGCTVEMFWVPRVIPQLLGMTTNVEFGMDVSSGRVVFGAPEDPDNERRNRYLFWYARRYGVPTAHTLEGTVALAVEQAIAGSHGVRGRGKIDLSTVDAKARWRQDSNPRPWA